MLSRLLRRTRALFRRDAVDRDMDDEIRFHIDMETEEGIRAGLSREEARRRALIAFGGVQRFREEGREARGVSAIEDLLMDLRYGARTLWRSPGFTLVALVTLALGVGANTAVFSVVNGILLRPLPYPEPESLISVWDGGHSRAEFTRVRDQNQTLESTAAYMDRVRFSLSGDGAPARLMGTQATADVFRVLRVNPLLGRGLAPGDDVPGNDRVVVLSHHLWADRFGADSSILGRSLDLDGVTRAVIGVMPRGFGFPTPDTELWVPLLLDETWRGFWGAYGHFIIGRLKAGVTREQVRQDLTSIAAALRAENPYWKPGADYLTQINVSPLHERVVGGSRRLLLVLLGAVGMILLIACANVANLLMARGAARQREMAIRATLGAARRRIVRQLVTESLFLAVLGGAAGLGLAAGGVRVLTSLLPPNTPRLADIAINGPVLAFTAGLAILTGLLFGVAPALRSSGAALTPALGEGSGRAGSGVRQRRLAGALVSGEIALAVVLAIGAGLLIRSFSALMRVEPGFRTQQVVSARISPPAARYAGADRQRDFYRQLLERLEGSPGVADAALTSQLPFDQSDDIMAMWVDGYTTDPNRLEVFGLRHVTPEFFRVMGIPLLQGRMFSGADHGGAAAVALVDEIAARRYWRGKDPTLGRIRYPWPAWLSVVGVVGAVKNNDLKADPYPVFYVPFDQSPTTSVALVARTTGEPAVATTAIRVAVAALATDVPVSDEQTMEQLIGESVAQPRFAGALLLTFALLALLLGAVGTYGLMAFAAHRRTREIAIRMALGARARDVLATVVREGAVLTGLGVGAGLALALGLTRFLRGLLFGVSPTDPITFVAVPALLAAVALLASYLPVRKVTRVDPMIAIRSE